MCRERIRKEGLPVTVFDWWSHIKKVLSAADIVVLTNKNEETPLSLIQSEMAGLPDVTTDVGSAPEVALDGVTGIITGLDVEEIADSLQKLLSNMGLSAQHVVAVQEFTLSHFGVTCLVCDHEELYK